MAQHVVIAGAGLAGLSLALALKRMAPRALSVTLTDPALAAPPPADDRAFAVAAAGRRMFRALGVWDEMARGAEPIMQMIVSDSRTQDVVRPVYLTFEQAPSDQERGEPYAHMVFSRVLTDVLRAACRGAGVTLKPSAVTGVAAGAGLSRVSFADGAAEDAALVVLASGKASARLREAAGIGWVGWEYEQSGIVATIRHERPHGGRACEHFLPAGPFAILPLPDDAEGRHQSSIVWTESSQDARTYLALPHEDLAAALETRFGLELGPLSVASTVTAWPLAFGMARRFISDRLALVGDAAHVIHPIAGQGLNLGLHDVAQLRDTVGDALRLGLDIGSADALKPYEQARRAATAAMGAVTDGLNRLFSNDVAPVRLARDLGLGLVDRMPALKARLIGEAAGSAAAPSLMRITPEDAPPPAA